jgi:hypothetical protein
MRHRIRVLKNEHYFPYPTFAAEVYHLPTRTAAESGVLFLGKMIDYKLAGRNKSGAQKVEYICPRCNKVSSTVINDFFKKKTPYCFQCATKQSNTKHGKRKHPLYGVWKSIRKRCNNPNDTAYPNYGGRGISVCKEWDDFDQFLKWAKANGWEPDSGLLIDRIDNNGNYHPENCRWVDRSTSNVNQRPRRDSGTGLRGVAQKGNRFFWQLKFRGEHFVKYGFATLEEAALARDKFIKENNLPHTLNFTTN